MVKSVTTKWRPRAPVVILAVLGIAVCTRLSVWQWQRGQAKADLLTARVIATEQSARPVARLDPQELPLGEHLELAGTWASDKTIMQDNQTRRGLPGVHVWSLFHLSQGGALMVDRGWMAAPLDRQQRPNILSPLVQSPTGLLRSLPQAALAAPEQCPSGKLPRLNYPSAADLSCVAGEPILPALLLLDEDSPGHYMREWRSFELPPERHYGYAVQWAALALTVLILFLVLNRR